MDSLGRAWLRRIALGLPLVSIALLQGCVVTPSSCPPPEERTFTITDEQRAMIAGEASVADGGAGTCEELCLLLDEGPLFAVRECAVSASGEEIRLTCAFERICR